MTLKDELNSRGIKFDSNFTDRAGDIDFDSTEELCESLGYITKHFKRLDSEIPEGSEEKGSYSISDGLTSGGNKMKYGKESRMYFDSTDNMPKKLSQRLQNDDKKRITGSKFLEACSKLGFVNGTADEQDMKMIQSKIEDVFNSKEEKEAFKKGLKK